MSAFDTPIFINAKDRVSYLKRVVERLRLQGYGNLHIVDTGSTYPPMLSWQIESKLPIYRCSPPTQPQLALWNCGILEQSGYKDAAFVYTDCDCLPDCPGDWCQKLYEILDRHGDFPKAGLALCIDDLPSFYSRKNEVLGWESQFWTTRIEPDLWVADIDTTLALHRPGIEWSMKALRLAGEYQARHLPWYEDSSNPSEEEIYYKEHMAPGVGHWR